MPPTDNNAIERRAFLKLMGMATLGITGRSGATAQSRKQARPNVLFIVVDDLRPQLGCYGRKETVSPHIDRLASQGTLFERAYCQVPVCGPSRVSVLTGIRTNASQWKCENLKDRYVTLPAHFRKQGYHAISNGKVFHHMHDRAEDWSEPPWRSAPIYHGPGDWAKYNANGLWQDSDSGGSTHPQSGRGPYCEAAEVPDNAYQDGKVADRTIADLKRLKTMEKPFFLACGFWRPHLPFNAPKKYWDLYRRDEIETASNRFRPKDLPPPCGSSKEIDRYGRAGRRKQSEEFHREARHAYYACVSYVDAQIGRVLDAIETLKLSENTIVVLWGDHGWHLGEHDFWGKHNTLNNALQAPLIVRAPGHKPNHRAGALVEFVDIYPTLCDLAGLRPPEHVQGTSLAPLLDNALSPWKNAVFGRWTGCQWVKTDRYLYTEWKKGQKTTRRMLFDHQSDPDENENVANNPAYRDIAQSLSRRLRRQAMQPQEHPKPL